MVFGTTFKTKERLHEEFFINPSSGFSYATQVSYGFISGHGVATEFSSLKQCIDSKASKYKIAKIQYQVYTHMAKLSNQIVRNSSSRDTERHKLHLILLFVWRCFRPGTCKILGIQVGHHLHQSLCQALLQCSHLCWSESQRHLCQSCRWQDLQLVVLGAKRDDGLLNSGSAWVENHPPLRAS